MATSKRFNVVAQMGGESYQLGVDFRTVKAAQAYAEQVMTKEGAVREGYAEAAEWAYVIDKNGKAI